MHLAMDTNTATLLASVVGTLVTCGKLMWDAKQAREREERHRRWDMEDRRDVAQGLAVTVTGQHNALQGAIQETRASTEQAIVTGQKAIVAGEAAYREANDVNVKLADQNAHIVRLAEVIANNKDH